MSSFRLTAPQRRKRVYCPKEPPFPVPIESQTGLPSNVDRWNYYTAHLRDGTIQVMDQDDIDQLYKMGFFGKGTLSRHRPQYEATKRHVIMQSDGVHKKHSIKIMSKRHYLRHKKWAENKDSPHSLEETEDELPIPKRCKMNVELAENVSQGIHEQVSVFPSNEQSDNLIGSNRHADTQDQAGQRPEQNKDTDPWDSMTSPKCAADPWGAGADAKDKYDSWADVSQEEINAFWGDGDSENIKSTDNDKCDMPQKSDTAILRSSVDNFAQTSCSKNSEISLNQKDNHSEIIPVECDEPSSKKVSFVCDDSELKSSHDNVPSTISIKINTDSKLPKSPNQSLDTSNDIDMAKPEGLHLEKLYDRRSIHSENDGDTLVMSDTDDSDIDTDLDTRKQWRRVIKQDPFKVKETLQLSMEEAFFLSYGLGCLLVYDENEMPQNLCSLWERFQARDEHFIYKYAVYHNFRSKGWVPKSGLKYGSDFVIYKQGPALYHSTYSVLVRHVRAGSMRQEMDHRLRAETWTSLAAINRTTEQVSKEIMICYVIEPDDLSPEDKKSPKCLNKFMIQEIVLRRWVSKQEREHAEYMLMP